MREQWVYSTQCKGIGGRIKRRYSDFVVEERRENRLCRAIAFIGEPLVEKIEIPEKSGEYLHLDLEKINKDLHSALRLIARHLHVSKKRIGYAGLKDKRAITCQRISIWEPEKSLVESFRAKGIRLREPAWSSEKIDLGMLVGNRFTIKIRDIDLEREEIEKRTKACFGEMEKGIANFFGEQRFGGIRAVSHLVGREIVRGNLENAVMLYLTAASEHEEEGIKEARLNLAKTGNFKQALKEFPSKYRYERAMLNALCSSNNSFSEALRALPTRLRFLFTHAYQAWLFNKILKQRLEEGIGLSPADEEPQMDGIPLGLLPGFESYYSPGRIGMIEREVMEKEGISFADFKLSALKECSSKGARRKIAVKPEKMELLEVGNDDFFEGKMYCTVRFELEKGAYATVVLRELTKNPNLNLLN